MNEILQASKVVIDPLRCPHCKGQDLVVYGQLSYPHEEVWKNGQVIEKKTNWEIKENFALEAFDCLQCLIKFHIKSDTEVDLAIENGELRDTIVKVTGKDPYGQRPC